jgi:hypothetical protein
MRRFFATTLIAAAFAVTGCSASVDSETTDDDDVIEQSSDELTAYGKKLVGAWTLQKEQWFEFDDLVLKSDGTYFSSKNIVCITTPCNPIRQAGKFKVAAPAYSGAKGRLRLYVGTTLVGSYKILKIDTNLLKLQKGTETPGQFANRHDTFCQMPTDCAGQPNDIMIKCAGGYHSEAVCTETSTCSKTCVADLPACKKTGCSGTVCSDKNVITTCEFKPVYACYATAICERGEDGACGWRKTKTLDSCVCEKGKRYVGTPDSCKLIRFVCNAGETMFSDAKGCGCQPEGC